MTAAWSKNVSPSTNAQALLHWRIETNKADLSKTEKSSAETAK